MIAEFLKTVASCTLTFFLVVFVLPWVLAIQLLIVIGEYYQQRKEEKRE